MIEKTLQIIIITISAIAIVWFLLPVFTRGTINIGNGTGIIVFGLIFIWGVRFQRIQQLIIKSWHTVGGKVFISVMGLIIVAIVALVVYMTTLLIKAADSKPTGPCTVVVLGCRVYGERPSLMLIERMDAAYDYLKENPETSCVLSGGQGSDEDITEAEAMFRYLIEKGIDESRMYKEEQSTSTRENILFSKKIIDENNLDSSMTIVTNEFHEYRASKIAEKLGINVTSVYGRTAWWLLPTYYVRELYGIFYEMIL